MAGRKLLSQQRPPGEAVVQEPHQRKRQRTQEGHPLEEQEDDEGHAQADAYEETAASWDVGSQTADEVELVVEDSWKHTDHRNRAEGSTDEEGGRQS